MLRGMCVRSVLAECMLPEGAHLRESDWTVFFLTNRVSAAQPHSECTGALTRSGLSSSPRVFLWERSWVSLRW